MPYGIPTIACIEFEAPACMLLVLCAVLACVFYVPTIESALQAGVALHPPAGVTIIEVAPLLRILVQD
jgi:hypothetical protein